LSSQVLRVITGPDLLRSFNWPVQLTRAGCCDHAFTHNVCACWTIGCNSL